MVSIAGASNFLISPLPTPNTIPNSIPPPPRYQVYLTFLSLNTIVIEGGPSNKEKDEASGAALPGKPSRAEKLASRALRVSTKTHKMVCVLAKWTVEVHASGLAIPPSVFL